MASIRIVGVPRGEAPLSVREAWVGLVLPLSGGPRGRRNVWYGAGVLSGPKSFLGSLIAWLSGGYERLDGYPVEVLTAVEILSRTNPEAAQWWRQNAPHLMKPGRRFVFDAEACQEEP